MKKQESFQNIFEKVFALITPGEEEQRELREMADLLVERINAFKPQYQVRGMLVGSAARNTWISGEHDIDVFILFSENTERRELEEMGLNIARAVLADAEEIEERYAEHPYLHGRMKGYEIDIVPCYNIKDPHRIKSAVDRTPHHNQFIQQHINSLEGDVRLAKQFLKTAGIYGSELRTQGFSGYLTELLIIHHGSFLNLLRAASDWKPPVTIDIQQHAACTHDAPLIVIDPVDPRRNVASVLSLDNLCRFIDAARSFLEQPDMEYFIKPTQTHPSLQEIMEILSKRGTALSGISFSRPNIVEDDLYPQLEKMRDSLLKLLDANDFRVVNSGYLVLETQAYLVFELFEAVLPGVRKHTGPPAWARKHAEKFKAKYAAHPESLSCIYIEDGRYHIDLLRRHTTPESLLQREILKCGLGKHIAQSIREHGFNILPHQELLRVEHPEFQVFLYNLLVRKQPS